MDGLFAALLIAPKLVPPSRYYPVLFGPVDDPNTAVFADADEAHRIFGLVMRHWNAVATALMDRAFRPSFDPAPPGIPDGSRWCRAFLRGVELDRKSWTRYLKSLGPNALAPIARLAAERDLDLFARTAMLDALPELLSQLYRATEPARARRVRELAPVQEDSIDVGTGAPEGNDRQWEVGLVPFPASIANDADARPVAVMIVSGAGRPIAVELESGLPPSVEGVASIVARHVDRAMERESCPQRIAVQEPAFASALRARPALERAVVTVAPRLPMITVVAAARMRDLLGRAGPPPGAAMSDTWMGWGLPKSLVAELFRSAAACYRAAPWERFADDDRIELTHPDGERWGLGVLGAAGEEFGLSFFLEPADHERMLAAADPRQSIGELSGTALTLTFSRREELRPAFRKEVMRHGWEVAGPSAYPRLLLVNTATGGITESQAVAMRRAIDAVTRFSLATTDRPRRGRRDPGWRDEETGVVIHALRKKFL